MVYKHTTFSSVCVPSLYLIKYRLKMVFLLMDMLTQYWMSGHGKSRISVLDKMEDRWVNDYERFIHE